MSHRRKGIGDEKGVEVVSKAVRSTRDRVHENCPLIQRIYDDHFEGLAETRTMAEKLLVLPFPEPDASVIRDRMNRQLYNAREWCDIINTFFHRLSGIPDARGRIIYD